MRFVREELTKIRQIVAFCFVGLSAVYVPDGYSQANPNNDSPNHRRIFATQENSSSEEPKKKQGEGASKDTSDDEPGEEYDNNSKRQRPRFVGTITVLGYAGGGITGGDGGYFVRPNLAIMGRYEQASLNSFVIDIAGVKHSIKSYGLYGKKLLGKSFYANFGLFHRILEASTFDSLPGTAPTVSAPSESTELITTTWREVHKATQQDVEIAIGNQWHWNHFTLGCDWVGAIIPISRKVEKNERQKLNKDGEYEADSSSQPAFQHTFSKIRLLAFYMGLSF